MTDELGHGLAQALAEHVRAGYAVLRDALRSAPGHPEAEKPPPPLARQGPPGPHQEGRDASDIVREHLRRFRRPGYTVSVTGKGPEQDDPVDALPDGTILFVPDPVDGAANVSSLASSFSSNVVAYIMDRSVEHGPSYRGVGLHALSAHMWDQRFDQHYWWSDQFGTKVGQIGRPVHTDPTLLPGLPAPAADPRTWTVASVAEIDGPNWQFLDFLYTEHKEPRIPVIGTPMVRSLVDQELTAWVSRKPSTVYDSAHLLLAIGMDFAVGDIQGRPFDRTEVLDMFGGVVHPKDNVIGPYIVAESYVAYQKLCDLLAKMPTGDG